MISDGLQMSLSSSADNKAQLSGVDTLSAGVFPLLISLEFFCYFDPSQEAEVFDDCVLVSY